MTLELSKFNSQRSLPLTWYRFCFVMDLWANGTGFVHHLARLLLFVLRSIDPFHSFSWATWVSRGGRHQETWNGPERPRNPSVSPLKSTYSLSDPKHKPDCWRTSCLQGGGGRPSICPCSSRQPASRASRGAHSRTCSCQMLTMWCAAHKMCHGYFHGGCILTTNCKYYKGRGKRRSKKCCL